MWLGRSSVVQWVIGVKLSLGCQVTVMLAMVYLVFL